MVTTALFFGRKDKTANKTAHNFDKEGLCFFVPCLVLHLHFLLRYDMRYAILPRMRFQRKKISKLCVYTVYTKSQKNIYYIYFPHSCPLSQKMPSPGRASSFPPSIQNPLTPHRQPPALLPTMLCRPASAHCEHAALYRASCSFLE